MRCQRIQAHLFAFLEGELRQRQHRRVAAHVATCAACATELRGLRQTLHLVQALEVPEPSAAFWEAFGPALRQRLRQETVVTPSQRRWPLKDFFLWPRPVLAAVAVSLILVGSLPFLYGPRGGHTPTLPGLLLSGGDEASLAADLDFVKHLDLLEEVEVLEQFDTAR